MTTSATSKPLQQGLTQIIQRASVSTATHIDPAVERLAASQDGLEAELQRLDAEMASVASVLETVTLDPETSARMQETQQCLKRTKTKLITVRGRLGRLRAYEESDRLQLTERSMETFQESAVDSVSKDDVEGVEVALDTDDCTGEAVVTDEAISSEHVDGTVSAVAQGAQLPSPESSAGKEEKTTTSDGLT